MSDILFLAHRLPFPPDRGDRIRSWNVLKALTKLAPVHVVALVDDLAGWDGMAAVSEIAGSTSCIERQRSKFEAMVHALLKGTPASVEAFAAPGIEMAVADALVEHNIDTIYAFSSQMAQYVPADFRGRFVMDFVDMDSAKFAEMGFAGRQEAKRLLAWETKAAKRADVSLFVSNAEAAMFTRETGIAVHVMGNGIDLDHFAPGIVPPMDVAAPLIVFTGQMDYAPNVEAVTEFAKTALPRIHLMFPETKFAIVGRAPTSPVRALASSSIIVTGEVADTRPWLAGASLVVAPLRIARGVQNKVLEAMAMGKPCLVSAGAAQGIDAVNGRDFAVADDFGEEALLLLKNPDRAADMGKAAQLRMQQSYSWNAQLASLAGYVGR